MTKKEKLVDGQKLDRQYRNVGVFDTREATVDDAARVVRNVSVSSDEPYERYYGTEILLHEKSNIDLSRVEKGASPLLYNHDRDAFIGKVSNPQLRNGKLYLDFKFSQSEQALQMLADLKDGLLTECSIGYDVTKYEVDEDEETYTATLWTLYECSLVTIPADFTVGVGRTAESKPVQIVPKIIETEDKKDVDAILKDENTRTTENTDMKRKQFLRDADKGDNATTGASPAEVAQKQQESVTNERKRVSDIQELSKHFAEKGLGGRKIDTNELRDQYIKDGKSLREFQDAVMVGTFKEIETEQIVTDDDSGASGIRVIGERQSANGKGRRLSIGAEFVRSKEFREKAGQRGSRRSIGLDFDVSMLGIRGKVAMAQRAGFASSDLSGVNVDIRPGVVGLGMQRLTIMDLLAPGTTDKGAILYPKENTFGTVDGVAVAAATGNAPGMPRGKSVGERGLKPLWDPDLTTDTATVKKIAVTTKVPDEFLSDFPASESYINERLPFMVDTETEFQILYGDGLNNNLKGIFSTTGIQARAIDATNDRTVSDSLKKGLTDIQVGSYFEPDGYAFHPYDWETASLLKDSQGRYLMGGPFYIPYTAGVFLELYTLWGKPVVKTTAVTYGRPVAGCWKLGAQYFVREGMRLEMTNANEDDFRRNLIAIRAEHRLALATYRPPCFIEFTGMPARA